MNQRLSLASVMILGLCPIIQLFADEPMELSPKAECQGHRGAVLAVAFSPNGDEVYSASVDKTVRRWKVDGTDLQTLNDHQDSVTAIAISRDGSRLLSASTDSTIRLWDLSSGKSQLAIEKIGKPVSVTFADNSNFIASSSEDGKFQTWKLEATAYRPGWSSLIGAVPSMNLDSDDKTCHIIAGGTSYRSVDVTSNSPTTSALRWRASIQPPALACSFSGDRKFVSMIHADGFVHLMSTELGKIVWIRRFFADRRVSIQLSRNGSHLVVAMSNAATQDTRMFVWNVMTDQPVAWLMKPPNKVTAIALSPNDKHVAAAGDDGKIVIWSLRALDESLNEATAPLIEATKRLNDAATDVIDVANHSLVPLTQAKLPYLPNAGVFASPARLDALGYSFQVKREMPVFLLVDWTYGAADDQGRAVRNYWDQLTKNGWIELERCSWNPNCSVFMHVKQTTGERSVPIMVGQFPTTAQVLFSAEALHLGPEERSRMSASAQRALLMSDVTRLVQNKSWNELETYVKKLRNEKKNFSNGDSALWVFYETLNTTRIPPDFKSREDLFKAWQKAVPKSATAKIGLAHLLIDAGWDARGTDISARTSEKQSAEMTKQHKAAQALIKDLDRSEPTDPMIDWCLVNCMEGLGGEAKNFREIGLKGLKKNPGFDALPKQVAHALLPRWYGKPGDVQSFAREVQSQLKGQEGDAMYGLVAKMIIDSEDEPWSPKQRFTSESAVEGIRAYGKRFPAAAWPINLECLIACRAENFVEARRLFSEIGIGWDDSVWHGEPKFREWRAAAQETKPPGLLLRRSVHTRYGNDLALFDDRKQVATCGFEPEVRLTDLESGKSIASFNWPAGGMESVRPQRSEEFVASWQEEIVRWKPSGNVHRVIPWKNPDRATIRKLSSDGSLLFLVSNHTGKNLIASDDPTKKLRAYSTETGKLQFEIVLPEEKLQGGFPELSLDPSGTILSISFFTTSINIIDPKAGKVLTTLDSDRGRVLATACYNEGKSVAAVVPNGMLEWDIEKKKIKWFQETNEPFGTNLCVSDDGRWWVLNVIQRPVESAGRLMIWDREKNDKWKRLPEIETTSAAAFADNGSLVTLSGSGFLRVWKLDP